MGSAAEKVVAEALKLDSSDRAEVVERLLRSLDEDEPPLDAEEQRRLHEAISRSQQQFDAGQAISADHVLADLDRR